MLTPKREKFAQKVVELNDKARAYRESFSTKNMSDKTVWEAASRLAKHSKVAARIEELQEEHCERHRLTVDDLIAELEESRQAAMTAKSPQTSAAVSATMGKARILGLDKQVLEHQNKAVEVIVNRPGRSNGNQSD